MLTTRLHTATDLLSQIVLLLEKEKKYKSFGGKLPIQDKEKLNRLVSKAKVFVGNEEEINKQSKQLTVI